MKNVLEYLERTASLSQNKIIDEFGQCTYADLLNLSQRVGTGLISKVSQNIPIPIFMEKGIHCLSAFFGSIYAGSFYVLLNPELPQVRLQQVLSQVQSKMIVTDRIHYSIAKKYFPEHEIVLIEELQNEEVNKELLNNIRKKSLDVNPLYANFTSGSTGIPKGVVINHISVIHFIDQFIQTFDITSHDVIGNQAPFDFDVSVKDIYSAIASGATLVMIPKRLFSKPVELLDFICDHHITTMIWAVSALCLISTFHGLDYKTPQTVNKVLFSGEVMPMKHLKEWMKHLPDAMFVNLYGPTEITCNCTYHIIDRNRDYDNHIPIGKAFDNKEVFLLEGQNKIDQENKVGEICVRGIGLSLGYYHNDKQSSQVFVQNPLHHYYRDIIYKTGDLGYWNEKKELVFNGRKDFQIKYMGHRIELEEIEKVISEYVERVCCLFIKERIYCFYVGDIDKKEIHRYIKDKLPIYMIPGRFVKTDEFPLTKNGKIDRQKLSQEVGGKKHG